MSDVKRYDMIAGDGPGVYPEEETNGSWVKADDYDTLATRLAEAEAWLDEVATLCVTAERRVAELARELERQKMNCLNLHQQLEDLKAQPGGVDAGLETRIDAAYTHDKESTHD